MPNRIVRENILTSERIDMLDYPAEVFYRRLMSRVDDYGLYDARPEILRATLYPLKVDRVREADISRWIATCEKAGLIVLYEAEGKKYLKLLNSQWERRSKPKYPMPKNEDLRTIANNCEQLSPLSLSLSLSDSLKNIPRPPPAAEQSFNVGKSFEAIWQRYPSKDGKKAAFRSFRASVKSEADAARITKALENYLVSDRVRKGFVKNGSTWFANWQDWVPSLAKQAVTIPKGEPIDI